MFRIIGLLVALLSCLATLTWAQGALTMPSAAAAPTVAPAAGIPSASDTKGRKASVPAPAGNVMAGTTNKSFFESRSNVAPDPAGK